MGELKTRALWSEEAIFIGMSNMTITKRKTLEKRAKQQKRTLAPEKTK